MAEPIDRLYWEEWARSLGWDAQKINEAGSLGSHAIAEGMTMAQAVDVVLAVVRDGQATPVQLSSIDRIVRLKGVASVAAGVVAMAIAITRLTSNPDLPIFPIAYALVIVSGIVFFIRDIGRRTWRVPALGLGLSLGALALWFLPVRE